MQQRILLLQRQVEGATALDLREEGLRQREAALEERERRMDLRNAELDQREAELLVASSTPRSLAASEETQAPTTAPRPRRKAAKEAPQAPVQVALFPGPVNRGWK